VWVWCILLWRAFFLNNDSATQTQREFRKHFNIGRNGKVPKCQTILNWIRQYMSTACALPKKNPGRPRSVHNPQNVERVRVALQ
jgi:transposase